MKDFMIDTEVAHTKGCFGKDNLKELIDIFKCFDSLRSDAFSEINSHGELSSVCNVSIAGEIDNLQDYDDKYNKFAGGLFSSGYADEYKEEVDKIFENAQRKVLNALSDLKLEDIEVVCTIGNRVNESMNVKSMIKYLNEDKPDDKISVLIKGTSTAGGFKVESLSLLAKVGKAAKALLFDVGCGAILCITGVITAVVTAETVAGAIAGIAMVVSGANSVANGITDIVNMFKGDWDKVGETNYMKQGFEKAGEKICDLVNADRGIGRTIGAVLNFAVDATAMAGGVVSAVKGIPALFSDMAGCKVYYIENILLDPRYIRTIRKMPWPVAVYKIYDTIGNKFSADTIYQDFKEFAGFDSSTTIIDDIQSGFNSIGSFFENNVIQPLSAN